MDMNKVIGVYMKNNNQRVKKPTKKLDPQHLHIKQNSKRAGFGAYRIEEEHDVIRSIN